MLNNNQYNEELQHKLEKYLFYSQATYKLENIKDNINF